MPCASSKTCQRSAASIPVLALAAGLLKKHCTMLEDIIPATASSVLAPV